MSDLNIEEFASLTRYPGQRRVEFNRTANRFISVEAIHEFWEAVCGQFAGLPEQTWDLITDLRLVSGRNNPAFEEAINRCRTPFYSKFGRSAVVVRSAAGMIQLVRLCANDIPETRIFDNLPAARAWLVLGRESGYPSAPPPEPRLKTNASHRLVE